MTTPANVVPDLFAPLDTTPANVVTNYAAGRSPLAREGGEGGEGLTPSNDLSRSVPLSSELREKGERVDRPARRGKPTGHPIVIEALTAATWEHLFAGPEYSLNGSPLYRTPALLPGGTKLEVSITAKGQMFFKISRLITATVSPIERWQADFVAALTAAIGGRAKFIQGEQGRCIQSAVFFYRPEVPHA